MSATADDIVELDDEAVDGTGESSEYLEMDDEAFTELMAGGSAPTAVTSPDEPVVETTVVPAAVKKDPADDEVVPPVALVKPVEAPVVDGKPADEAKAPVNYEDNWKKITAPFNANGKEMQVDSVDDAIQLMKMGANYNKKMAAMKPGLKALKMLENNGLLDEGKLSFLIDVHNKNPAAIAKLVQDGKVSPLDLDEDKAGEYKPTSHAVDDSTIELDSVLDEIQESPHFQTLIDTVSKKWDAASKQVFATNPQLLKVIEGHMASGVFPLISTALERQKTLGRLNGMTDLAAYQHVGDQLHASGAFDHLFKKEQVETPPAVVPVTAKSSDALKDKKRAASAPKSAPAETKTPSGVNPLSLSDEDFGKEINTKFL